MIKAPVNVILHLDLGFAVYICLTFALFCCILFAIALIYINISFLYISLALLGPKDFFRSCYILGYCKRTLRLFLFSSFTLPDLKVLGNLEFWNFREGADPHTESQTPLITRPRHQQLHGG